MIFHVKLEASDGYVVAECPALPGCISQGADEKERFGAPSSRRLAV